MADTGSTNSGRANDRLCQRHPLRRCPIKPRSKKREKAYELRREIVARILEERPLCELETPVCSHVSSCVDEIAKRGRMGGRLYGPGSITDEANLRSACAPCNSWLEDHPAEAEALGIATLHAWEVE